MSARPLLLLLTLSSTALSGCFWGDVEGGTTFTVTSKNVDQYEGLLYPTDKTELWAEMFRDRPNICPPDADEDCPIEDRERSDSIELFLRYDTSRVRGHLTQKGDLQITAHLDVGKAYKQLAEKGLADEWDYLSREDRIWGTDGDGCGPEVAVADRTGVGRCVSAEVTESIDDYQKLNEDVRLVVLVNLPGEDDVRSVQCQEAPRTFASTDWTYPRSMLVNYDATGPIEDGDETRYGTDDDEPLPQCEVEVFSRLTVATQVFAGDFYGEGDDNSSLTIEEGRDVGEELLPGTVVLEELTLPSEGAGHAKGRYKLAFTAQRFSEADGQVVVEGNFDVEVRPDPEQVDDPDRDIDLEPSEE